jgi:hypothetical protein
MSNARLGAAALTAGVAAAVLGLAAPAPATGPSRLLVAADEYSLTLSRAKLAPGRAVVQLLNRGEDDHDLRLRRISRRPDRPIARWKVTAPSVLTELELRLSRGRYRLWCSLAGHRKLGMRATLRVGGAR